MKKSKKSVRPKGPKKAAKPKTKAAKPARSKNSVKDTVYFKPKSVLSKVNSTNNVAIMLLDEDRHFFVIDGFAAQLWQLIDGKSKFSDLLDQLGKNIGVKPEVIQSDASKMIKQLLKEKLLSSK